MVSESLQRWRVWVWAIGPLLVVVAVFAGPRVFESDSGRTPQNTVQSSVPAGFAERPTSVNRDDPSDELTNQCEKAARRLEMCLGNECALIVRPPFVIAGSLSEASLVGWYEQTIRPATLAMQERYFEQPPNEVVTVLLFDGRESYDHYAAALFGDRDISIYGYYKPAVRTLVMNIATGGGTLVHELTHALIDFDFQAVPDWFNEGLASLHEQCRFETQDRRPMIRGLVNWRLPALQAAIEEDRLQLLKSLIEEDDFRSGTVSLNYAQARYFCMFLQETGRLEEFYQALRSDRGRDPLGVNAVNNVFADHDWPEIEQMYRDWVSSLSYISNESP